jgi:Fe-Mn family superoxide dismutase
MEYTARTFDLPELKGLSAEQIKVHLTLYEGYVKHANLIMNKIKGLREADAEGNAFLINELRRRLSFEFDGMRMHEYYFDQFVGGAKQRDEGSALYKAALDKYGAQDLVAHVKEVAGTRGIGWVVVYWDGVGKTLHTQFVNDHELGQLAGSLSFLPSTFGSMRTWWTIALRRRWATLMHFLRTSTGPCARSASSTRRHNEP